MDIVLSLDDKAGAVAQGLAKFVADIHKDTGPGAAGAVVVTAEILESAVANLVPSLQNFSEAVAAIKADKVKFALALADLLVVALEAPAVAGA